MIASELRRLSKFNHNVVKAARAGNLQDMEENLKEGDINFQDNYGWTPLMWATYRGNLDCVEALIARGATSTKKSKDGWPALCIAVSLNNIDFAGTGERRTMVPRLAPAAAVAPLHALVRTTQSRQYRARLEPGAC